MTPEIPPEGTALITDYQMLVDRHREQDRALAAEFDATDLLSLKVPSERWSALRAAQRWEMVAHMNHKNAVVHVEHRTGPTKSEQVLAYVAAHVGQTSTVKALAQHVDCSESTVHSVIRDNPGHFKPGLFAGTYTFLDPVAERAREAEELPKEQTS